jgi:hypothetical protein
MSSEIVVHESDLQDLLNEVREDLSVLLKSDRLSKAEESKPGKKEAKDPSAEISPKEDAPTDAPADDSAPAAAADPVDNSAMGDADAMSPEASAESAPEMAPDMAAQGDEMGQAIEPAPSIEALQAEYEQLPENELMMHLVAAHAACLARGGLAAQPGAMPPAPEAPMDPMAAAPEAAAPAPDMAAEAPAMPPEEPEVAMKAEVAMKGKVVPSAGDGNGDTGAKSGGGLKKSAQDLQIEALTAKVEDQEKALMELVAFTTTPFRKSVKNISDVKFIERTEVEKPTLTKSQIQAKLLEQAKNPDLKKSDRALINGFYDGSTKIEQLEHLLKG